MLTKTGNVDVTCQKKYVIRESPPWPATFNPNRHAASKQNIVYPIVSVIASGRSTYCCLVQVV